MLEDYHQGTWPIERFINFETGKIDVRAMKSDPSAIDIILEDLWRDGVGGEFFQSEIRSAVKNDDTHLATCLSLILAKIALHELEKHRGQQRFRDFAQHLPRWRGAAAAYGGMEEKLEVNADWRDAYRRIVESEPSISKMAAAKRILKETGHRKSDGSPFSPKAVIRNAINPVLKDEQAGHP